MNRLLLADAVDRKPGSSEYKALLSSSFKYGLTTGTEHAAQVELTALGGRITKPVSESERLKAIREAARKPAVLAKIYDHYTNAKLPTGQFFRNTLEREFAVPREHVEECEARVLADGKFAGMIREISGAPHVLVTEEDVPTPPTLLPSGEAQTAPEVTPPIPPAPAAPPRPRLIFIGHGKNRLPLDQLKGVLNGFKVPYKVAVDEPHTGRPISEKVAATMKECSAGIFIFTTDEGFVDKSGNAIYRPSENVIYELGAASVLYGNKVVIFKEEGVQFPTDFSDIGHISFEKNRLDAKASELVRELIGFGILQVSVA